MINLVKKNIFLIICLILTLGVVNTFLFVNKNFYNTEVNIELTLINPVNKFERLILHESVENFILNKTFFEKMLRKTNTAYFGSNKNILNTISSLSNFSEQNDLKYKSIFYVTKKFDQNKYDLYLNKNLKSNFYSELKFLEEKKINLDKRIFQKCIIENLVSFNYETRKENTLIFKLIDELYNFMFIQFKSKNELFDFIFSSTLEHYEKTIFMKCINLHYINYFYLTNLSNIDLENLKIEISFGNYKNNKLIYFLNIIILLSIIFLFSLFKTIAKLKRPINY